MSTCCEIQGKTVPVKIWSPLDAVEPAALAQLRNIASLPWVYHHVAAMADVHLGIGATVGAVIATKDAISPAAVGVDIGCGMMACRTNLRASHLSDSLRGLRQDIENTIPVGPNGHSKLAWVGVPSINERVAWLMGDEFGKLTPEVQELHSKAGHQIGTLGGGNHFIELCLDTDTNAVWLMLHSGSRNIGKCLAEIHIARAQKLAHNAELVDPDLAAFLAGTPEMEAYRRDLYWAQQYAALNRRVMLHLYQHCVSLFFSNKEVRFDVPIACHHNYVAEEVHFGENVFVTRKGAISARVGELGIIPGSMGTASYIVRGLGNADSFCSASHGAGRRMSRGAAKRLFSVGDLEAQTAGVECRKDLGVIDEIPGAYKDIDVVMSNQSDLVEVVARLKQVMCVKG
jgi:tRNA-splicing ligase RtcB